MKVHQGRLKNRTNRDAQPAGVKRLLGRLKTSGERLEAQQAVVEDHKGSFRMVECRDASAVRTLEALEFKKVLKFWYLMTDDEIFNSGN
jgi:hypothetical protein